MKGIIRNTLLVVATGLLMAHNFVPHKHFLTFKTESLISENTQKEANLLDLFKTILTEDLGYNHLEKYFPSKHSNIINKYLQKSFYSSFTKFINPIYTSHFLLVYRKKTTNYLLVSSYKNPFYSPSLSLRAPPII